MRLACQNFSRQEIDRLLFAIEGITLVKFAGATKLWRSAVNMLKGSTNSNVHNRCGAVLEYKTTAEGVECCFYLGKELIAALRTSVRGGWEDGTVCWGTWWNNKKYWFWIEQGVILAVRTTKCWNELAMWLWNLCLGRFQERMVQSPEWLGLKSVLTLLWAGGGTRWPSKLSIKLNEPTVQRNGMKSQTEEPTDSIF